MVVERDEVVAAARPPGDPDPRVAQDPDRGRAADGAPARRTLQDPARDDLSRPPRPGGHRLPHRWRRVGAALAPAARARGTADTPTRGADTPGDGSARLGSEEFGQPTALSRGVAHGACQAPGAGRRAGRSPGVR